MISSNLKNLIVDKEQTLLKALEVRERLSYILSNRNGLCLFAEAFYFIRYNFYKLNFIVGAKCPPHEKYWSGLTKNLLEELGGGQALTHNQLYRQFLWESSNRNEDELTQPKFTVIFDNMWGQYCSASSYKEGLLAIGLYEALDNPDYQLLYSVIKGTGISRNGLEFFRVHAQASHFEIFEDIICEIEGENPNPEFIEGAINFVINSQQFMWSGILSWLETSLNLDQDLKTKICHQNISNRSH
jgi:hypothetical protein